jgi:hypothetical protein
MKDDDIVRLVTAQSTQAIDAAISDIQQKELDKVSAEDNRIRSIYAQVWDIDQQLLLLQSVDVRRLNDTDNKANKVEIDFLNYKRNKVLSNI